MAGLDLQHGKDQVGAKLASSENPTEKKAYALLEDVRHRDVTLNVGAEASAIGAAAIKASQQKLNIWLERNGMPPIRENGILLADKTHKSDDGYNVSAAGVAFLIFQQAQDLPRRGPWIGAKTLTQLDKVSAGGNDGVVDLKKNSEGRGAMQRIMDRKIHEISEDRNQRETLEGKHGAEAQRDLKQKIASAAYAEYGKNFAVTAGN